NTIGLARRALLRTGKFVPIARLLVVGELAVELRRHVAKLEPAERARLLALLRQARGGRHALTQNERSELLGLVARMEPQAFIGMAVKRASPIVLSRVGDYARVFATVDAVTSFSVSSAAGVGARRWSSALTRPIVRAARSGSRRRPTLVTRP